jgi:hypothetical protein
MSMDFLKSLPKTQVNESFENILFRQLAKAAEKLQVKETKDPQDHVTFDIPLLVRVFELVREGAKTDVDVHEITERILSIKNKGILTMDDYAHIAGPITKGEVPDNDMGEADDIEHGYPMMPTEDIDLKSLKALAGIYK